MRATRGYQAVDWHEGLTAARGALGEEIDRLGDCDPAVAAIDLPRLKSLLDDWPSQGWEKRGGSAEVPPGNVAGGVHRPFPCGARAAATVDWIFPPPDADVRCGLRNTAEDGMISTLEDLLAPLTVGEFRKALRERAGFFSTASGEGVNRFADLLDWATLPPHRREMKLLPAADVRIMRAASKRCCRPSRHYLDGKKVNAEKLATLMRNGASLITQPINAYVPALHVLCENIRGQGADYVWAGAVAQTGSGGSPHDPLRPRGSHRSAAGRHQAMADIQPHRDLPRRGRQTARTTVGKPGAGRGPEAGRPDVPAGRLLACL